MQPAIYRRRLPHIHLPGACVFITFRLASTQSGELAAAERDAVAEHVRRMTPGELKAWVVMPDHVHVLYRCAPTESLRATLQSLKSASAHTLTRRFGRVAPVWQGESYDHVVRTEPELLETWRYVEANPVRRGLVPVAEAYPWSSAHARS
jgi:REP element-mobilizing transposase RayT